ncbi:hypothetical protein JBL43_07555 [Aureibaculum sp. A20]|uniref:Uncharacterized protein n=1 Tax=Aureibaculum flavum TaxID=2795986 RepID=A0ABS0WQ42_9FLAO|nr:exopolysaccharide Pel transporter PelG [Aureibaculum flavum]MBJ2174087.1 hypothetical protein [Aureibaculum flavum]
MQEKENDDKTELLIASIKEKIGFPVNQFVVQAIIESFGIRNIDVKTDYGKNSIKELGNYIYNQLITESPDTLKNENEKNLLEEEATISISNYTVIKTKLFLKYFPSGLFHLFPVFLQIAAIVIFGYSLWTYLGFNELQSTAVVFGVILGLVLTGGFVQVIGRQASFYWYHDDLTMVKKTIYKIIIDGIKAMLAVFIFIAIINFMVYLYPFQFLLIVFSYAFLIGVLLLFLAPMHTIKKRWVVSVAILLGTILAITLKTYTILNIYLTHWIGIAVAVSIMFFYLKFFFRKIEVNKDNTIDSGLAIIYKNYSYFIYGTLVYVFVFTDRIIAWSTSAREVPYIVYYEKNYEIGMDIAILVFLLLAGILEYNIAAFTKFLNLLIKSTPFNEYRKFNKRFYNAYWRQVGLLFLCSFIIFFIIYLAIVEPWGYEAYFKEPLSKLSVKVTILGAVGYTFFTWGMLNALYLFTLNQPNSAVKAITIAICVNIVVGILASRIFSYENSTWGMLIGSVIFMLITLKACLNFFKNLDYYYNASH